MIDKVLEKYSKKGPAGNYCLLQVLSDGGKEEGGNFVRRATVLISNNLTKK